MPYNISGVPQQAFQGSVAGSSPINLQSSNQSAIAKVSIDWKTYNKNGAVCLQGFSQGISVTLPSNTIDRILGLVVDNGNNGSAITIYFPDTGFQFEVKPYTLTSIPVITNGVSFIVYGQYPYFSNSYAAAVSVVTNIFCSNVTTFYSERNRLNDRPNDINVLSKTLTSASSFLSSSASFNLIPGTYIEGIMFDLAINNLANVGDTFNLFLTDTNITTTGTYYFNQSYFLITASFFQPTVYIPVNSVYKGTAISGVLGPWLLGTFNNPATGNIMIVNAALYTKNLY